jgi:hypothetical protein
VPLLLVWLCDTSNTVTAFAADEAAISTIASIIFMIELDAIGSPSNRAHRAILLITSANPQTPAPAENPADNHTRQANRDQDGTCRNPGIRSRLLQSGAQVGRRVLTVSTASMLFAPAGTGLRAVIRNRSGRYRHTGLVPSGLSMPDIRVGPARPSDQAMISSP